MSPKYILALDQGTTSSRAVVFDTAGRPLGVAQREFTQIYPKPGWVEHDPDEIWESQIAAARDVLARSGIAPNEIAAIGISNQRETTLLWDRRSGRPIHNAIVWQCRRTAPKCDELKADGFDREIKARTGLVVDAYFSGTKLEWLLSNVPGAREAAERGDLLFGTVDTWLIWKLTGGQVHATDYSNASRTMLYNIRELRWDETILARLAIPAAMLPEVRDSSGVFGYTDESLLGARIPIAGVAGDQQASLFGHTCFAEGTAKNTYGTGCFILMNTGERPVESRNNLLTTIAWGVGGKVEYALEGSVFNAGAAVQWLRDGLQMVERAADTEPLALSVPDTGGVYVVPAFTGLGAPYWDMYARGTIVGLTRGTGRAHLVRAVLESIAYQTRDVFEAMAADSGIGVAELKVDGGACANDFLMQFQADLLGARVNRPVNVETTALGVAYLAGLAVGYWRDRDEIAGIWESDRVFSPTIGESTRARLYAGWKRAVERSSGWADRA